MPSQILITICVFMFVFFAIERKQNSHENEMLLSNMSSLIRVLTPFHVARTLHVVLAAQRIDACAGSADVSS